MRFIVFALAALVALSVFAVRTVQRPIEAAPVEFTVQVTGAEEVPPVNSGSAVAKFKFNDDTNLLEYDITVSGVPANQVTAAHFHRGAPGVNGPIIYTLSTTGFTNLNFSLTLTPQDEADLKNGQWYVNIHSQENPSGFARGQMIVPGTPGAAPAAAAAAPVNPPRTGDGGLAGGGGGAGGGGAGLLVALMFAGFVVAPGLLLIARKRA
jgi:CHRD domain